MKCITCGSYFKANKNYNNLECETCFSFNLDEDVSLEIELLTNPSGRTQPKFEAEQDYDIDSFSS
jgi:hypothetical protein